jgi:hypothetical protein
MRKILTNKVVYEKRYELVPEIKKFTAYLCTTMLFMHCSLKIKCMLPKF